MEVCVVHSVSILAVWCVSYTVVELCQYSSSVCVCSAQWWSTVSILAVLCVCSAQWWSTVSVLAVCVCHTQCWSTVSILAVCVCVVHSGAL